MHADLFCHKSVESSCKFWSLDFYRMCYFSILYMILFLLSWVQFQMFIASETDLGRFWGITCDTPIHVKSCRFILYFICYCCGQHKLAFIVQCCIFVIFDGNNLLIFSEKFPCWRMSMRWFRWIVLWSLKISRHTDMLSYNSQ